MKNELLARENGWTPERRARQAEAIKRWRPWEKSTGPKTADGKAAVSMNALTHGATTAEARACRRRISELLRHCKQLTEDLSP